MKKITVYTMEHCPYCVRAKQLLKDRGLAFEEVHVDISDEQSWKSLQARSGMKTLPQIFFGEDLVGGYTELATADKKGELRARLAD